jgi:chaperonin cofactor prefoldin
MADFDDTQGRIGDTSGRIGDTSGRIGDTSGRIGDTSGQTLEDVRREVVRGRLIERIIFLENKVARLEQDIFFVADHLDRRMRALDDRISAKASDAQLQSLQKEFLTEIKKQITAAVAPLEARLKKLETPPA